jgi:hypothetical protein
MRKSARFLLQPFSITFMSACHIFQHYIHVSMSCLPALHPCQHEISHLALLYILHILLLRITFATMTYCMSQLYTYVGRSWYIHVSMSFLLHYIHVSMSFLLHYIHVSMSFLLLYIHVSMSFLLYYILVSMSFLLYYILVSISFLLHYMHDSMSFLLHYIHVSM